MNHRLLPDVSLRRMSVISRPRSNLGGLRQLGEFLPSLVVGLWKELSSTTNLGSVAERLATFERQNVAYAYRTRSCVLSRVTSRSHLMLFSFTAFAFSAVAKEFCKPQTAQWSILSLFQRATGTCSWPQKSSCCHKLLNQLTLLM